MNPETSLISLYVAEHCKFSTNANQRTLETCKKYNINIWSNALKIGKAASGSKLLCFVVTEACRNKYVFVLFFCFEGSILQLQQFCFSELAYKQLSENKFPCSLCDDIMASLKDVKLNFYISQKISKLQLIGSDRFTVFCSSFFLSNWFR